MLLRVQCSDLNCKTRSSGGSGALEANTMVFGGCVRQSEAAGRKFEVQQLLRKDGYLKL